MVCDRWLVIDQLAIDFEAKIAIFNSVEAKNVGIAALRRGFLTKNGLKSTVPNPDVII